MTNNTQAASKQPPNSKQAGMTKAASKQQFMANNTQAANSKQAAMSQAASEQQESSKSWQTTYKLQASSNATSSKQYVVKYNSPYLYFPSVFVKLEMNYFNPNVLHCMCK